MKNRPLEEFYRCLVSLIKEWDRLTGNKVGDAIRNLTNLNTSQYWDNYLKTRKKFWRNSPYILLLEVLPKNTEFSLLDIGCALGDGCELLKENFPLARIYGADFSRFGIDQAKSKSNQIDYFVLDITRQEINRQYDYIVLVSTLEHFNDPFRFVDKCLKSVLKAIYIIAPYERDFTNPRLYWWGEHRYLFNEKTFSGYNCSVLKITDLIQEAGRKFILYRVTA